MSRLVNIPKGSNKQKLEKKNVRGFIRHIYTADWNWKTKFFSESNIKEYRPNHKKKKSTALFLVFRLSYQLSGARGRRLSAWDTQRFSISFTVNELVHFMPPDPASKSHLMATTGLVCGQPGAAKMAHVRPPPIAPHFRPGWIVDGRTSESVGCEAVLLERGI